MHRKAARSVLFPERAKRLTLRAINYAQAARLAEREERDARRLEQKRLRERRESYARSVSDLPPTWTHAEREARIRAYDELHAEVDA